ncbi:hypothetical protein FOL47_005835 [Perkinsus chesapeaki]|uniref:Uncharacterized protein n=1 Tax=Perkinsus chesapeaki TaxID=330153 RepID=A0A7J6LWD9_PERCH|nr:hypothetical protein FOL47_005835 [Perkinsus chesapeaki]
MTEDDKESKDATAEVAQLEPIVTYSHVVGYLTVTGEPLDFSFKDLGCCEDLVQELPRSGTRIPRVIVEKPKLDEDEDDFFASRSAPQPAPIAIPEYSSNEGGTDEGAENESEEGDEEDIETSEESTPELPVASLMVEEEFEEAAPTVVCDTPVFLTRPITVYLKLNNNTLKSLAGFSSALEAVMVSFRERLSSFVKLQRLPKLRSLTANGNPVEGRGKMYRLYIVGALTQSEESGCLCKLKSFDHSVITEDELSVAQGWYVGHLHREKLLKERLELLRDQQGMLFDPDIFEEYLIIKNKSKVDWYLPSTVRMRPHLPVKRGEYNVEIVDQEMTVKLSSEDGAKLTYEVMSDGKLSNLNLEIALFAESDGEEDNIKVDSSLLKKHVDKLLGMADKVSFLSISAYGNISTVMELYPSQEFNEICMVAKAFNIMDPALMKSPGYRVFHNIESNTVVDDDDKPAVVEEGEGVEADNSCEDETPENSGDTPVVEEQSA